ncbi:MAG: hypothetical protein H7X71_03950 [Chitinophagales bacterium]|nr:hypothetical protein [Chitinophagales bacterium]
MKKINRRNWLKISSLFTLTPLVGKASALSGNDEVVCDPTTEDILGPYYLPDAPFITALATESDPGTKLFLNGTVFNNDCITPTANALIEVWHASDAAEYDQTATMKFHAQLNSNPDGTYSFSTILPGAYLNGAQYRPKHIHFKVSSGEIVLITQLYFEGDPYIPDDPWASEPAAEHRIIPLTADVDGSLSGTFDIVLDITTSIQNHPFNELGFFRQNMPNPFNNFTQINVGVFKPMHAEILISDLQGKLIKTLLSQQMANGRYWVNWDGRDDQGGLAAPGVYIAALFFDGKLMRSIRMIKQ